MALTVDHYRFGTVEGTESTHGWKAGENRDPQLIIPGVPGQYLLRVGLQNNGTASNNSVMQHQRRQTRAGVVIADWANINNVDSTVVRTGSTTVFTNGQNCTKRLSCTGTFEASGAGCTHDGSAGGAANDVVANGCTETILGCQVLAADTQVGDLIEHRVVDGSGVPYAATVTPSFRVGLEVLAVQSRDTSVHFSQSAGVTKIANTLVNVECSGMSPADLADATLTMEMNVWGTTVVGSTDPADYTVHLYGPDVWSGGSTGKDGLPVKPGFGFSQDIPEGVRRVLATFQPSRTVTFGANATTVEQP